MNSHFQYLQLKEKPEASEIRREWLIKRRASKKIEIAIQNCPKGPKDFDCTIHDYISSKEKFVDAISPLSIRSDSDTSEYYQNWIRSDVDDF